MSDGLVSMVLTIELVTVIGAAVSVAIGVVFWVLRQLDRRDSAIKIVKSEAQEKIADLKQDLADYKLHSSETYATKSGVSESFDKLMASIEKLSDRINSLIDRELKK